MAKKKTKKVTAPLTYDPGKGRPKEHLAYLNWQEMQALKRLNGNNQERGPKGLPSFPPNDAIGSSSKASSTKSSPRSSGPSSSLNAPARTAPSSASKSPSKPTGSSSVSRISGGTAGSNAARSALSGSGSTSRSGSASVSRISGGTAGSNAARSALSGVGGTSRGGSAVTQRGPAASMAASKDSAVKNSLAARDAASARKNPGFKADVAKGGAIGGIFRDKSVGISDGKSIKGAIRAVREQAAKIGMTPTGYVQQNLRGPLGPRGEMRKGLTPSTDAYRLGQVSQALYNKFNRRSIEDAANFMGEYARALPGEAGINLTRDFNDQAQRMRDLGRIGINQALNISTGNVLGGIDTYSRPEFQKPGTRSMGLVDPSSPEASRARDALSDAMTRPITATTPARDATNFTAPGTPLSRIDPSIRKLGSTGAGNYGVDPAYARRTSIANAEAMRRLGADPGTPNPSRSKVTETRVADAPIPRLRPESQNMQRPTAQTLVSGGKLITERSPTIDESVAPSWRMGTEMQGPMRPQKQFTDRIVPSIPSATSTSWMDAPERILGVETFTTADVNRNPFDTGRGVVPRTPTPSSMRSATQVASALPAGVRTPGPSGFRSATGAAASIPPGVRTPSPSNLRSATQAASNIRLPAPPSYSAIPEPDSIGLMPSRADAANVGGYIGAAISGVRALPSAMAAINDAASLAGKAISQYSTATTGVLGIMGGKALANMAVSDAAKQAIDAGAQKVAALQESWNNAIKDAKRVDPGVKDSETEDIANGLATVGMAEGYKLGEGKVAQKTRGLPAPQTLMSANAMASRPYDIRLGGVEVNVPMKGADGGVVSGVTTIDSYVESVPGLDDAGRSALRLSLISDATKGNLDFTTSDMKQRIAEAKEATSEPSSSEYLDPAEALPRNVDPEAQKEMRRQEKLNKAGTRIIKSRNPAAQLLDAGTRLFTGQGIADNTAALKRQYMQSSPDQQAALESRYPNLTKFASDVGLTPQLPMSNYTSWADRSGLRAPTGSSRFGGGISEIAGGIQGGGGGGDGSDGSGSGGTGDGSGGGTGGAGGADNGRRPDIYYMWDLGVNIPSPNDPTYTMYMTYLAERNAAAAAMYR